jgi:hypothetical protein
MSKLSPAQRLEWKKQILRQQESGMSIEQWCRENKIVPHLFYYWKDRFLQTGIQKESFIEVKDKNNSGIIIEYFGFHLLVDKHFDPLILKKCLSLLREIKC